MSDLRTSLLVGLLGIALLVTGGQVFASPDPQQLVRTTTDNVLREVTSRKAELDVHPERIYPLVEREILPYFDFRSMTQSAMGRFWRQADDEQRNAIVREFQTLLVRSYATVLLGYSGESIEYPPVLLQEGSTEVVVPTRIGLGGAPPVPINYHMRAKGEDWMVFDIVVDKASLLTNYRSQFASVIQRRGGVAGLIDALRKKNARS